MRFYPSQDSDHAPIRYFGRVPVYAATILAAAYFAGMLATTILATARVPLPLVFVSTEFYGRGWLWQIATCTFVNGPSFFFLFGVFFYYRFGVDIEQFFGRRTFLKFYALTIITPAVVLGVWHLLGRPGAFAGMYEITIGMFIAYATLYPNLEFLGWVPMKYVAFACLVIASLGFLPAHDWQGLSLMLGECGLSFGFIRYAKLGGSVELGDWARKFNPFRRRAKFRVLPSPNSPSRPAASGSPAASVDHILDKIAQKGFASLTNEERDQLEKARDALTRKSHRGL